VTRLAERELDAIGMIGPPRGGRRAEENVVGRRPRGGQEGVADSLRHPLCPDITFPAMGIWTVRLSPYAHRARGGRRTISQLAIAPNRKRVALAGVAAVEAAAEPSHALLARPARELRLVGLAEGVVADRVRGGERFAEILVRDLERRACRVTPDPCEAIRLELDAHRVLVRGLPRRFPPGGTDQVLNVVTDLVRNHV